MEACQNYRDGGTVGVTQTEEGVEVRLHMPRGRHEVPMFEVSNSKS